MLTFIHTHINISSTTKSGATIWNGREVVHWYLQVGDPSPITDAAFSCYCSTASLTRAGKVAVEPIARFFTSHAFTNRNPPESSPLSTGCIPHFDPST